MADCLGCTLVGINVYCMGGPIISLIGTQWHSIYNDKNNYNSHQMFTCAGAAGNKNSTEG